MASLVIFRNPALKHLAKSDQKIGSTNEVAPSLCFRLFEKQIASYLVVRIIGRRHVGIRNVMGIGECLGTRKSLWMQ